MERSPPDSEALLPKIYSISSAQVSNFNEEQIILNARKNRMKIDVENVRTGRCWVNKETDLVEKSEGLLMFETMKFEEERKLSRRECGELRGKITRLNWEHREVKKIAEKYSFEELNKKTLRLVEKKGMEASEKDEVILKLNEKINELNEKINELENHSVEKLKLEEKLQSSEREFDKSMEEITMLIEDKRQLLKKSEEKDEMILHLNNKINELNEKINELENHSVEKLKLEEKLQSSEREFDKSMEEITMLIEDKRQLLKKSEEKDEMILHLNNKINELNEKINELENHSVEKLKLEEKLQSSERECNKSKEEITMLIEDKRQLLKKTEEKDEMILHLNNKINELGNQKLETENIAEMYEAKIKSLNLMMVEKNEEVDKLKQKKSVADEIVENLSFKLFDADHNLEEYKKRFRVLNARVIKVEQDLADVLKVKVNDLTNQANDMKKKKSVAAEESSGEKKSPLNGRRKRENDYNQMEKKKSVAAEESSGENKRPLSGRRKRENDYHFQNETSLKNDIAADDSPSTVVCALNCSTNEMNSVPRKGKQAMKIILDHSKPAKKHLENAGCSRKMAKSLEWGAIVKYNGSDDEATKQEDSLMISGPERKRIAYGSENSDDTLNGALREKRRQELTLAVPESLVSDCFVESKSLVVVNQPSHGISITTAATDSDDDSISSACIEDIIANS